MNNKELVQKIKDEEIEYVDIRFTDPRGKLQHVTVICDEVDEDFLEGGFMFDGSSIAGWKSIEESDMKLMPDASSAYIDPFYAEKTICVHCSIVEPDTGEPYARDPRGTAEKAEAYLKSHPASVTSPSLVQKLNSSCSTTFASRTRSTKYPTKSTPKTHLGTQTPSMKWATWATAQASKAATSPSTQSTTHRTSVLKCSRP